MENARELELIEKREKLERTGNRILKGFLIIFFLGYAVFFTSRLWLPTPYEGVAITPIGKSVTVEDRTLTIDSWKYSKEQREMEIIVEVNKTSLDSVNTYKWSVATATGKLDTKAVHESKDIVVLKVTNVPRRWTELALNMSLKQEDMNKGLEFSSLKVYTNDKHVDFVKKIKHKSTKGYLREAYLSKIEGYKAQLKTLRKERAAIKTKITNADKMIKDLTDKMQYQTSSDQQKTGDEISNISSERDSLNDRLKEKDAEIKEMQQRIDIQKELLNKL